MNRLFIILTAVSTICLTTITTQAASALTSTSVEQQATSVFSSDIWTDWNNFWSGFHKSTPATASPAATSKPVTPVSQPMPTPAPAPVVAPVTAPTQVTPPASYAALGDSVAAGLGLAGVTTPTGTGTQCGRSSEAYPYTVASVMKLPLNHIACSGATAGDLFTEQGVDGPNISAQLDGAFAAGTPALITITAGANDAHWSEFVRGCYVTNCATGTATFLANSYLTALQAKLYIAFSSIYLRSAGTPPTVVITGYYNPVSSTCTTSQSNITASEITWLSAENTALNQTIANVSRHYSFVRVAPVDFTGHDICSLNPWVQSLTDAAPFHPTTAGEQVIAQSVLRSLGHT